MKMTVARIVSAARPFVGRLCMVLLALLVLHCVTGRALADTDDITTTTTTLIGYWTAIKAVAIGVVLFVLGRKLLKKV